MLTPDQAYRCSVAKIIIRNNHKRRCIYICPQCGIKSTRRVERLDAFGRMRCKHCKSKVIAQQITRRR